MLILKKNVWSNLPGTSSIFTLELELWFSEDVKLSFRFRDTSVLKVFRYDLKFTTLAMTLISIVNFKSTTIRPSNISELIKIRNLKKNKNFDSRKAVELELRYDEKAKKLNGSFLKFRKWRFSIT